MPGLGTMLAAGWLRLFTLSLGRVFCKLQSCGQQSQTQTGGRKVQREGLSTPLSCLSWASREQGPAESGRAEGRTQRPWGPYQSLRSSEQGPHPVQQPLGHMAQAGCRKL